MRYLADQRDQATILLYQNILIDTYGSVVLGVILGNCVFDAQGKARAKFFHNILYNMDGRILARESGNTRHLSVDGLALMHTAWEIVRGINDHYCPLISPLQEWSSIPVSEHFTGIPILVQATA